MCSPIRLFPLVNLRPRVRAAMVKTSSRYQRSTRPCPGESDRSSTPPEWPTTGSARRRLVAGDPGGVGSVHRFGHPVPWSWPSCPHLDSLSAGLVAMADRVARGDGSPARCGGPRCKSDGLVPRCASSGSSSWRRMRSRSRIREPRSYGHRSLAQIGGPLHATVARLGRPGERDGRRRRGNGGGTAHARRQPQAHDDTPSAVGNWP